VSTLRPGDRVAAWLNPFAEPPRALAERVCLPAAQCVGVPDGVSLDIAAVAPVAGLSALQMIRTVGAQSGQRVLVHGAAGGVGSFVVPMLKDRRAIVVATGGAASQSFLAKLGADACVDYTTPVDSWPGPFDAIIDCASSLDRATARRLLAAGHVATTLPSFPHLMVDPILNPLRRVRFHALRLQPNAAELTEVLTAIAAGRLPVHLSRTYRFDESVEALAASRGGRVRGKLAIALG
jgi:NADPH:quinone reductase-like Zn-dependent oxidoreductase